MSTDSESSSRELGDLLVEGAPSSNGTVLCLIECPACGADLTDEQQEKHIGTHEPEDFGLTASPHDIFRPMADIMMERHGWGESE